MTTTLRKLAAAAILAATVVAAPVTHLAASATPSGTQIDDDRVMLRANEVDFGYALDPFTWEPIDGGFLDWYLEDGVTTPHLWGMLVSDDVFPSCARMQIVYLDGGRRVRTESGVNDTMDELCPSGYGDHVVAVDLDPFGAVGIDQVLVRIQVGGNGGSWITVREKSRLLN